jgi:hypothetical protein
LKIRIIENGTGVKQSNSLPSRRFIHSNDGNNLVFYAGLDKDSLESELRGQLKEESHSRAHIYSVENGSLENRYVGVLYFWKCPCSYAIKRI